MFASNRFKKMGGFVCFAVLAATNGVSAQTKTGAIHEFQGLLRADLVVRGLITSVVEDLVPATELSPTWSSGGKCQIAMIQMSVDEVVRGWYEDETLAFVVDMSSSSLRGSYAAGEHMIVSLKYRPDFRNGTFFSAGNRSRFVLDKKTSTWVRQGGAGESLDLREIRELVRPAKLDVVVSSSDKIVVGLVTDARRTTVYEADSSAASYVWVVTANVDRVLKGAPLQETITFQMFQAGTYWPSWADPGPSEVITGGRYCIFLKTINGILYSAGGVNGFFSVGKDDQLVRNGLLLPVTIDRVRDLVEGRPISE